MLRAAAIILGLVFLLGGIVAGMATRSPGAWIGPIVLGALILLGTLFERSRYKRIDQQSPGPGWSDTGERFHDPESGDLVSVYSRDRDGDRRYIRVRS
jgi:hypothetical protein